MSEPLNEGQAQFYTSRAQEMWKRACVIATNETKRHVILAVMAGHLSEYKSVPNEFLHKAVTEGIWLAMRTDAQIIYNDPNAKPVYAEKAIEVSGLLIAGGIYKPPPAS